MQYLVSFHEPKTSPKSAPKLARLARLGSSSQGCDDRQGPRSATAAVVLDDDDVEAILENKNV